MQGHLDYDFQATSLHIESPMRSRPRRDVLGAITPSIAASQASCESLRIPFRFIFLFTKLTTRVILSVNFPVSRNIHGLHMSFDCSREVNPSLAAQTTANRLDGFKSGSTSICGASSHSVKKSSRFTGLTSISRRIPLHLSLPYTAELTYLRLKP